MTTNVMALGMYSTSSCSQTSYQSIKQSCVRLSDSSTDTVVNLTLHIISDAHSSSPQFFKCVTSNDIQIIPDGMDPKQISITGYEKAQISMHLIHFLEALIQRESLLFSYFATLFTSAIINSPMLPDRNYHYTLSSDNQLERTEMTLQETCNAQNITYIALLLDHIKNENTNTNVSTTVTSTPETVNVFRHEMRQVTSIEITFLAKPDGNNQSFAVLSVPKDVYQRFWLTEDSVDQQSRCSRFEVMKKCDITSYHISTKPHQEHKKADKKWINIFFHGPSDGVEELFYLVQGQLTDFLQTTPTTLSHDHTPKIQLATVVQALPSNEFTPPSITEIKTGIPRTAKRKQTSACRTTLIKGAEQAILQQSTIAKVTSYNNDQDIDPQFQRCNTCHIPKPATARYFKHQINSRDKSLSKSCWVCIKKRHKNIGNSVRIIDDLYTFFGVNNYFNHDHPRYTPQLIEPLAELCESVFQSQYPPQHIDSNPNPTNNIIFIDLPYIHSQWPHLQTYTVDDICREYKTIGPIDYFRPWHIILYDVVSIMRQYKIWNYTASLHNYLTRLQPGFILTKITQLLVDYDFTLICRRFPSVTKTLPDTDNVFDGVCQFVNQHGPKHGWNLNEIQYNHVETLSSIDLDRSLGVSSANASEQPTKRRKTIRS